MTLERLPQHYQILAIDKLRTIIEQTDEKHLLRVYNIYQKLVLRDLAQLQKLFEDEHRRRELPSDEDRRRAESELTRTLEGLRRREEEGQ